VGSALVRALAHEDGLAPGIAALAAVAAGLATGVRSADRTIAQ